MTFDSYQKGKTDKYCAQFRGESRLRTLINHMTRQHCCEVRGADNYSVPPPSPTRAIISGTTSRSARSLSLFRGAALAVLLLLTACTPEQQKSESTPTGSEWHEFQGTWTATG